MARAKKKTISKRKKTSGPGRRGAGKGAGRKGSAARGRGGLWIKLAISLLVVIVAYLLYQDMRIRYQFEGKRWALPARVYARALEIFPGKAISKQEFGRELKLLKYRAVSANLDAASYIPIAAGYVVGTRSFRFWDGEEETRFVRVRFEGDHISSMEEYRTGASVPLLRFDPALIASIYPSHNEDRVLVRMQELPEVLVKGLVAVEDRKFYQHHGIDFLAIGRAMLANIRAGRTVQGGSTLTQQLIKNYFLTNTRSLWRKANEAAMALLLESHYSKQEILEAYLNEVYLGQDGKRSIHGFGLASQFYFEQPLEKLQLHQQALLIGLVKGPSWYDPRRSAERARERRNLVLTLLHEQGIITQSQLRSAQAKPLGVTPKAAGGVSPYPAFLDLVRRQLRRDYREEDLASEGLQVFTTLDPLLQQHTEQGLVSQLKRLEQGRALVKGGLQGAVVVTSVDSGEVVAMVGGRDPRYAGFNRALDAVRPIGSLVKPAVYLTALSDARHYTLSTLLSDEAFELKSDDGKLWSPRNYDKEFHGPTPLVMSLARSLNVATARLGMEVGLEEVAETIARMGISRPFRPYPSMLLGAIALSPLEVAQMYQTLAGGGFHTPLRSIRAVLNAAGEPLQRYPLTVEPVFAPEATYLLNYGLQVVMEQGTGKSLYNRLPAELTVAGKTGTTDDLRDSWFAGFTGDYQAVVWLGMDDNQPAGLSGSSGALQVWGEIMQRIRPAPLLLSPPAGVELVWVELESGQKSAQYCQGAVQLPFIQGTAPVQEAPCRNRTMNWFRNLIE